MCHRNKKVDAPIVVRSLFDVVSEREETLRPRHDAFVPLGVRFPADDRRARGLLLDFDDRLEQVTGPTHAPAGRISVGFQEFIYEVTQ